MTSCKNPRIHVVELLPHGFQYYKGSFQSFEETPPRYTWRKVDYRIDDTIVYFDLQNSKTIDSRNFT